VDDRLGHRGRRRRAHGIVVDTCVQPGEAPRQVVVIASDDETFAVLGESIAARAC
jgi:hypothetical protein